MTYMHWAADADPSRRGAAEEDGGRPRGAEPACKVAHLLVGHVVEAEEGDLA